MSLSSNGIVYDDAILICHPGNADGNGNFIHNYPLTNQLYDLSGNNNHLTLNNFAGTETSGAVGNNTLSNVSAIVSDQIDDSLTCTNLDGASFPQNAVNITFTIEDVINWNNYQCIFGGTQRPCLQVSLETIVDGKGVMNFRARRADGSNVNSYLDYNLDLNGRTQYSLNCSSGEGGVFQITKNGSQLINEDIGDTSWLPSAQVLVFNNKTGIAMGLVGVYQRLLSLAESVQNYNAGSIWQTFKKYPNFSNIQNILAVIH